MFTPDVASLDALRFDGQSPRFPRKIAVDDESILHWMLVNGDIIRLMMSIGAMGYQVCEPLLVVRTEEPDAYRVVDGNRRLAALRLLRNPELASCREKTVAQTAAEAVCRDITAIPVLIYPSRKEILVRMGYRHITGGSHWLAYDQAAYFYNSSLNNNPDPDAFRRYGAMSGLRPGHIKILMEAFDTLVRLGKQDMKRIQIIFPLWCSVLFYDDIREALGLHDSYSGTLEADFNEAGAMSLFQWLFEFPEATDFDKIKSRVAGTRLKSLVDIIKAADDNAS